MAVSHNEFKNMNISDIDSYFRKDLANEQKVLVDVKGIFNLTEVKTAGYRYWRL